MKKLILFVAFLAIPSLAHAQASDVCKNANNLRSVSISINTATTTRLVDNTGSTGRYIVPCGFTLSIIGAATPQTLVFITGTGTTCGTGTTTLTGAMAGPGAATDTAFWVIPAFAFGKFKNGDSFCVTTTTVQQISGLLSFVFVGPA